MRIVLISLLFISTFFLYQCRTQEVSAPHMESTHIYSNHGVRIDFAHEYIIRTHHPHKRNYFAQAKEIVLFDDWVPEKPVADDIDQPRQMLVRPIDSTILDTALSQPDEFIPIQALSGYPEEKIEEKRKSHTSLSNSFYDKSALFILPKISEREFNNKLEQYQKRNPDFSLTRKMKRIIIETGALQLPALSWRLQLGKTRIDHYMVFGDSHNYLFSSSPYGERDDGIQKIISRMEFTNESK